MCRIASLSLLQRLKESMSGDARDFNNMETRAVIIFFLARQGAEVNSRHYYRNIRRTCIIVCHRQKLGGLVKRGDFSTCDAPSPVRPKTVNISEIIDQIHELILEDRRISAKSIAEQQSISLEPVGSIIHGDLDMQKLSAKWVPKCLNADHKRQPCQSSEQLLEFFRCDRNDFLSRLVTMDETWLYYCDPETNQWNGGIAAHPTLYGELYGSVQP